jgi:putative oxidoreductase
MSLIRLVARPLLASTFALGAVNAFKNAPALEEKAKPVTDVVAPQLQKAVPQLPNDPVTLVRINAGIQLLAALALAKGTAPRLSSTVLAASLVPTTIAGHPFWEESDPGAKQQQLLHFAKNASVLGGLILAAVDTEGRPGVAWRAQHAGRTAARTARREAKHVRREATLAAKAIKP